MPLTPPAVNPAYCCNQHGDFSVVLHRPCCRPVCKNSHSLLAAYGEATHCARSPTGGCGSPPVSRRLRCSRRGGLRSGGCGLPLRCILTALSLPYLGIRTALSLPYLCILTAILLPSLGTNCPVSLPVLSSFTAPFHQLSKITGIFEFDEIYCASLLTLSSTQYLRVHDATKPSTPAHAHCHRRAQRRQPPSTPPAAGTSSTSAATATASTGLRQPACPHPSVPQAPSHVLACLRASSHVLDAPMLPAGRPFGWSDSRHIARWRCGCAPSGGCRGVLDLRARVPALGGRAGGAPRGGAAADRHASR